MARQLSEEALEAKRIKQREKQYATQQRQIQRQREKQQEKRNDTAYIEEQKEKQRLRAEKQWIKQREKQQALLNCPKAIAIQKEKQLSAQKKAQEQARHSAKRSLIKQLAKKKILQKSDDYKAQQYQKILSQALSQKSKPTTARKQAPIKSKGLKGRTLTMQERYLTNKLAALGCICCRNQGWYTEAMNNQEGQTFISMHHVEGRVKPWAHAKQLPLCQWHHQIEPPTDAPLELFPLHGNSKKSWEKTNGTQEALLEQVYEMINEPRPWLESVQEEGLNKASA